MNPELTQLRHEAPDDFAREFMEHTLQHDREQKIEITLNGPDDLPNRVFYIPDTADEVIMILPMSLDERSMLPAQEIGACCMIARKEAGGPFLVCFCAEVYAQYPAEGQDVPTERGVITQRYHRGDPNTTEALSMMTVHRRLDGALRTLSVTLPFRYEDGSVTFGETLWIDSLIEGMPDGAIPEAMVAAFGSEQN